MNKDLPKVKAIRCHSGCSPGILPFVISLLSSALSLRTRADLPPNRDRPDQQGCGDHHGPFLGLWNRCDRHPIQQEALVVAPGPWDAGCEDFENSRSSLGMESNGSPIPRLVAECGSGLDDAEALQADLIVQVTTGIARTSVSTRHAVLQFEFSARWENHSLSDARADSLEEGDPRPVVCGVAWRIEVNAALGPKLDPSTKEGPVCINRMDCKAVAIRICAARRWILKAPVQNNLAGTD
jgi:hypothetical protein